MKNGFTLIEMMIVVAIIGILAAVAIPAITGKDYPARQYCVSGYVFDKTSNRQIIDAKGAGIPCDKVITR